MLAAWTAVDARGAAASPDPVLVTSVDLAGAGQLPGVGALLQVRVGTGPGTECACASMRLEAVVPVRAAPCIGYQHACARLLHTRCTCKQAPPPSPQCAAQATPTLSPALYVQRLLPAMLAAPGKASCIVLDFADSALLTQPQAQGQPQPPAQAEARHSPPAPLRCSDLVPSAQPLKLALPAPPPAAAVAAAPAAPLPCTPDAGASPRSRAAAPGGAAAGAAAAGLGPSTRIAWVAVADGSWALPIAIRRSHRQVLWLRWAARARGLPGGVWCACVSKPASLSFPGGVEVSRGRGRRLLSPPSLQAAMSLWSPPPFKQPRRWCCRKLGARWHPEWEDQGSVTRLRKSSRGVALANARVSSSWPRPGTSAHPPPRHL